MIIEIGPELQDVLCGIAIGFIFTWIFVSVIKMHTREHCEWIKKEK